ncbi:MAG: tetratricopeptide repeat protein, partial [Alphaproteobacteria bacterium]
MSVKNLFLIPLISFGLMACGESTPDAPIEPQEKMSLGTVNFATSCNAEASPMVERAVALLHNMIYEQAKKTFRKATEVDPDCAIAYWGHGMSLFHPLWPDRPSAEDLALGEELAGLGETMGAPTARERAYISTISAYFKDGASRSEADRLKAFSDAWQNVHDQFPDDQEATAFYVLSQLTQAVPSDKTYAIQNRVGPLVEEILETVPDHPGAHHYIIHSYDFPGLAIRALPVARNYTKVGPKVTHALHMSTHIFTRLGLWDESIQFNIEAAEAALKLSEELGFLSIHYTHALDYLAYGYLQQGKDEKAEEVWAILYGLEPPFQTSNEAAMAYPFSAVPGRLALERQDWERAITLVPRTPDVFHWRDDIYPFIAPTHFARGLGFAHLGRFEEAAGEVAILLEMENTEGGWGQYWSDQIAVQRLSVEGWVAYKAGNLEEGLALMHEANEIEMASYKGPLYPNEVLHASELLGDMLLEMGSYGEAMEAYEISLARSPNRLNSLYGMARAAELSGNMDVAATYYQAVVDLTAGATADLARIAHAQAFVTES